MRIRYPLFLLFYLVFSSVFAKQNVDISFHHDTKFLFTGDQKGNNAGTLNFIIKIEAHLKQFSKSHLSMYPSFEYSDLGGGSYRRYSIGIGYIQEKVFFNNLNLGFYPNYGAINRNGFSAGSFGFNIEAFYKISKRFSLSYLHQMVERSDLKVLYNESSSVRPSSFVGFKIHL